MESALHRLEKLDPDVVRGRYAGVPFVPQAQLSEVHSKRLSFWMSELEACCEQLGRASLSPLEGRQLYTRPDGLRPLAVSRALAELAAEGRAVPLETHAAPPSLLQTLGGALASPVAWLWSPPADRPPADDQVFVLPGVLERLVRRVVADLGSTEGAIFDAAAVDACIHRHCATARDEQLVADAIERRGLIESLPRPSLRKLASSETPSEGQMTEYELERTYHRLELQEEQLEAEISRFRAEARIAAKESRRDKALTLLKRAKVAEASLKRRLDLGTTVMEVLSKVQTANLNRVVYDAAQKGADAMKSSSIDLDKALDVMEEIQELGQVQEELSDVLGESGRVNEEEQDELEEELKALMDTDTLEEQLGKMAISNQAQPERNSPPEKEKDKRVEVEAVPVAVKEAPKVKRQLVVE